MKSVTISNREIATMAFDRLCKENKTDILHASISHGKLTMDFIRSLMEDSYTLVWVNYDDNLNENLDVIETCMKEKKCDDPV